MVEPENQKKKLTWSDSIRRCVVSCSMVLLSQFSLSLVPRFFFSSSILIQLSLSVIVLLLVVGIGRGLKRVLGINGSASAFVFFTILFIWCFYVLIIRPAVSLVMDFVFNGEVVMLITGLCSMLKSDPGLIICEDLFSDKAISSSVLSEVDDLDSEGFILVRRVRYCKICKAGVKGFDHHCPAFGNCIGENNYRLFVALLIGFLVVEASFLACSYQYVTKFGISSTRINSETTLSESLAISTGLFCILQLAWQVVFLGWHIYCICFNIRTDEWINWMKYSEFQSIVQWPRGQGSSEMRFTNPYDKGVLHNVKEFLLLRQ